MPFTELFGGQVLLPSNLTYLSLAISADLDLVWPLEQQIGGTNVVADIIDLSASAPGLNIDMPDARLAAQGTSVLFNNVGAQTVSVRNQGGGGIISLVSGTTWMIYLVDNTTANGTWRTFQFGASVSVANAAALAGAGLKAITTTLNARIVTAEKNATPYAVVDGDRAVSLVWTGGVGAFNLAAAGTVGADWFCYVRNSGSGDLTVTPPAGTIDGAANKTYPAGASSIIVCDGANYYTLGFGTGSGGGGSGFDFITINVAGNGNYVLSGAELGRIGYRFTGVLTGTRNIVVPGSTDEYWVDNQTTGAFSLFVKTVAQVPGIEVLQNNRNILYCDGANVIAAESATVSFPIPVAQGGTGAVTAAAARTNLGSTATGDAIFTAVNAAAAQTAIGIALAATNAWTAYQDNTNADPAWELNETDAAANNRRWSWRVVGEVMQMGVWNDARNAFVAFFSANRTLNVVDDVTFAATTINIDATTFDVDATTLDLSGDVVTPNTSAREVGFKGMPSSTKTGSYSLVASDAGTCINFTGGGVGTTMTLPNATLPTDSVVTFKNKSGGTMTLSATGTLNWLSGSGNAPATGARVVARGGVATVHYIGANTWDLLGGVGIS